MNRLHFANEEKLRFFFIIYVFHKIRIAILDFKDVCSKSSKNFRDFRVVAAVCDAILLSTLYMRMFFSSFSLNNHHVQRSCVL